MEVRGNDSKIMTTAAKKERNRGKVGGVRANNGYDIFRSYMYSSPN